jgi:hypothetical protein
VRGEGLIHRDPPREVAMIKECHKRSCHGRQL